jgi:hypothetical protein
LGEVASLCNESCGGQAGDAGSGGGSCAHALCSQGEKLSASCDPCAASVCAKDAFCCSTSWDPVCVGEVAAICKKSCD